MFINIILNLSYTQPRGVGFLYGQISYLRAMSDAIRLFATGGHLTKSMTISMANFILPLPSCPVFYARGRSTLNIKLRTLMQRDSLEFTDIGPRFYCSELCSVSRGPHRHHPRTDTMTDTAYYLAQRELGKTIVLTGAMIHTPLAVVMASSIWAMHWRLYKPCP